MSDHERDGYIRFICHHNYTAPTDILSSAFKETRQASLFQSLLKVRLALIKLGLLGMHPDGTGFGNVSIRLDNEDRFLISGTATGGIRKAGLEHFAIVEDADPANNSVRSRGPVKPSSECMSHQALYAKRPETRAVLHIHSEKLWKTLQGTCPLTPEEAAYGTPELALAIQEAAGFKKEGIIILGGHFPGLMIFADTPETGLKIISRVPIN